MCTALLFVLDKKKKKMDSQARLEVCFRIVQEASRTEVDPTAITLRNSAVKTTYALLASSW